MVKSSKRKPETPDNWDWLDALIALGPFDDDVIAAVNEKVPQQERPEIDAFFNSLPDYPAGV